MQTFVNRFKIALKKVKHSQESSTKFNCNLLIMTALFELRKLNIKCLVQRSVLNYVFMLKE